MKLSSLNPRWLGTGGPGMLNPDHTPMARREGVGLEFDCPCGKGCVPIYIHLANPLDDGPSLRVNTDKWQRTGEDFDTMTLKPSIRRLTECGWHGWVTNGEITTCAN